MENAWFLVRGAARLLCRGPGIAVAVVCILAPGSGLSASVFSVFAAALLRPLPWQDPDRLVLLSEAHPRRGPGAALRPANYFDLKTRNDVFEGLTSASDARLELTGAGEPRRVRAQPVLDGFFSLLGVAPAIGRALRPADYSEAAADVVVLSHSFWRRQLGLDPSVVGLTLKLDGRPRRVVGVMPPDFQGVGGEYDLWVPWALSAVERENRETHEFFGIARLKSGVTLSGALAHVSLLYRQLEQEFPAQNGDWKLEITPLRDVILGQSRFVLLGFLVAVTLVLLTAMVNASGLLLARALDRQKEMATRIALGAGRVQLVRQLLAEGLLLALLSGAMALLVASWSIRLLAGVSLPTAVPFAFEPRLDWRVVTFTVSTTIATGIVLAVAPAQFAAHLYQETLSGLRAVSAISTRRSRRAIVLCQLTLGFVLLALAAISMRGFVNLQHAHLGFDPDGVVAVQISLPEARYASKAALRAFQEATLEAARSTPGVVSAAIASGLPLQRVTTNLRFVIEGREANGLDESSAEAVLVSGAFFEALKCPIVRGRSFESGDTPESPGVVVLDEALARFYWPGEDPLGKRLRFPYEDLAGRWFTVIGVASPIRFARLSAQPGKTIYLPQVERPDRDIFLLLRTDSQSKDALSAVMRQFRSQDPALPLGDAQTMEEIGYASLAGPRQQAWLLGSFAILAVTIGSTGLYALLAYSVAGRTRELGIRQALGARRGDLVRLVMNEGLVLTTLGIGIGAGVSLALTLILKDSLYAFGVLDPASSLVAAALLFVVTALASWLPARRAASVQPSAALHWE